MATKTFLQYLKSEGLIDSDAVAVLEEEIKKGKTLEEASLEKKLIKESDLFKAKSKFLNIPLRAVEETPSGDVLKRIPEDAAVHYKMIPVAFVNNQLLVGVVYPDDIKTKEALKFLSLMGGFQPVVNLITLSDYNKIIDQYRTLTGEVTKALEDLDNAGTGKDVELSEVATYEEGVQAESAPISKTVAVMIRHAVDGRASDIHIEPQEKELRVRFRVDGVLHTSLILPKEIFLQVVSRIKILSNLRIDERRVPQDGRFRLHIDEKNVDFRVSTFPTAQGEKVVMRILDPTIGIKTLNELGLWGENLRKVQRGLARPFGMTLITGPTGSGKSTTMAAIMNILNKEGINLISLEDPIEYYLDGTNQSQVRPELGYTFASGLRSILRQDPDIIMVGEVRDSETAELTVHAALTGHMVLSTLHTNDAVGVVPRMIDMGVAVFLIPSTLNLAIAQRLVRRLCPDCKKAVKPSAIILKIIEKTLSEVPDAIKKESGIKEPYMVYEGAGCARCGHKGTRGRLAVFEILEMNTHLENLILKHPTESEIEQEAKRQGMITMLQDGIMKALQGEVSVNEALRVAKEASLEGVGEGSGIVLGGK